MNRKILLVDDEQGIRKVLKIALEDIGYQVMVAGNGEEAIDIFREAKPEIVLTDIKMPGMDGIEVLKKIKEESPDTEVIMITGHGDMELAIQSLKNDATDFVTKPINSDALEIALKRAGERIFFRTKLREYTENLEQLVEEKTNKLLEAERMAAVGQAAAGLAHAIKNITGGLKGGAYVLEKGIELNKKRYLSQGWDMIKGNIDRINNMAMDLLNYAKEREPEYRLFDPNEPVEEVYELMLSRAREKGIDLELDLDKNLPKIRLDPEEVHLCLLNLTTNAMDACLDMESPQERSRIILRTLKNSDGAMEYQVIDNGCGMDKDTKDKIFRRFFSKKGSRGTGLGLMITKKIVDALGGEIDFRSEKDKGTEFHIRFPL